MVGRGIYEEFTMNRIILGLVIALTLMVSQSWAANWVLVYTHPIKFDPYFEKKYPHNPLDKVETYIDADRIILDEEKRLIYVWIRKKRYDSDNIDYYCFRWEKDEYTTLSHGELDFFGNVIKTSKWDCDGKTQTFIGPFEKYALQKALELKGIKYEIHK